MLPFTCWLFLDFDGVTHPYFPRADLTDAQNQYFSALPIIEAVLRRHPEVGVVIASSWRHVKPLPELIAVFSPDLHERIVGITPDVPPPSGHGEEGSRQKEVEAWLLANGQHGAPWVGVDDVIWLYEPGASVVRVPDLFSEKEAALLDAALTDPAEHARRWPVPDHSSARRKSAPESMG
jgi:hypothetical protein